MNRLPSIKQKEVNPLQVSNPVHSNFFLKTNKTPNDMSDKKTPKKSWFFFKKHPLSVIRKAMYSEEEMLSFSEDYADQEKKAYLKDVLEEVENDFKARIYITLSNTKTIDMNETLKHQLTKEIWNTSKEVLNHIKQTKG